jgi:hypothetical protein
MRLSDRYGFESVGRAFHEDKPHRAQYNTMRTPRRKRMGGDSVEDIR